MASLTSAPMRALPMPLPLMLTDPMLAAAGVLTYSLAERQLERLAQLKAADHPLLASVEPAAMKALLRHLRAEASAARAARDASPALRAQYEEHQLHVDMGMTDQPLVPKRCARARAAPQRAAPPTIDQLRVLAARPRPDYGGHRAGDLSLSARRERVQMREEWNAIKKARAAVAEHDRQLAQIHDKLAAVVDFSPGEPTREERQRAARAAIERRRTASWQMRVAEDVQALVDMGRALPTASHHPSSLPLWLRPDPWARLR